MFEFYQADLINQLIGHGPESWKDAFDLYAHNTFVSYIYEYGIAGIISFLLFVCSFIILTLRAHDKDIRIKVLACFIGYLIMNLATMPLWNLEGLITLAILFSLIFSESIQTRKNSL
jgi:O-antigen ligase